MDVAAAAPPPIADVTVPAIAPADAAMGASTATTIDHSLAALQPEFRQKLESVIDRMAKQYGYDVGVNETYRTQSRQNALYAQGRTAPGPVVTWTDHSLHTEGLAADLTISGGNGTDAAQVNRRLAMVASQEGLRTLGPQDPLHVELPRDSSAPAPRVVVARPAATVLSAQRAGAAIRDAAKVAAAPAGAAPVATVARVAQVARVATVARPAVPGPVAAPAAASRPAQAANRTATRTATPDRASAPPVNATPAPPPALTSHGSAGVDAGAQDRVVIASSGASSGGDQPSPGPDDDSRAHDSHTDGRDVAAAPSGFTVAQPAASASAGAAAAAPPPAVPSAPSVPASAAHQHSSIDAQIARVDAAHDAAATQPMSQVVLKLDNASGGTDRIRVGVRHGSIEAVVGTGDAALSQRLTDDLGRLRDTLQQQGLEVGTLHVHSEPSAIRADGPLTHGLAAVDAAAGTSSGAPNYGDASGNGANRRSDGSPSGRQRRQWGNPDRRQQSQHQGGSAS